MAFLPLTPGLLISMASSYDVGRFLVARGVFNDKPLKDRQIELLRKMKFTYDDLKAGKSMLANEIEVGTHAYSKMALEVEGKGFYRSDKEAVILSTVTLEAANEAKLLCQAITYGPQPMVTFDEEDTG